MYVSVDKSALPNPKKKKQRNDLTDDRDRIIETVFDWTTKAWFSFHVASVPRDKRLAHGSSAFSPAVIGYGTDLSRRAPDSYKPPPPHLSVWWQAGKAHTLVQETVCVTWKWLCHMGLACCLYRKHRSPHLVDLDALSHSCSVWMCIYVYTCISRQVLYCALKIFDKACGINLIW